MKGPKSKFYIRFFIPAVIIASMTTAREYKVNRELKQKEMTIDLSGIQKMEIKKELTEEQNQKILDDIKKKTKVKKEK